MQRTYKVTYARDCLDPNPTVKTFDEWYEMKDWITSEVARRVPLVAPEDRTSPQDIEYPLINIKEV